MNNDTMVDVDPLSSYDTPYDYPVPNPHNYPHPPHPTQYPYKEQPYLPLNYPIQTPYPLALPEATQNTENHVSDVPDASKEDMVEAKEEIDIKPDITLPTEKRRSYKRKGKISDYWNKKITDKDFAFYGCSVCNVAYKDLTDLDQHVLIHSNRMTSYDLRIINMKKRKLLKREKKLKKKEKKDPVIKVENIEMDIEIKPEDGYIGTEKANEFDGQNVNTSELNGIDDKSEIKKDCMENNENNPENNKDSDKNHINVYKCFGCNKQFALSYYLRIHVRSHTDEKPYTCNICNQKFITASKMGRHKKRVHLTIKHQCRICYKIYNRFELLVKHFDLKHAEDKLEGEPYDYNEILPYIKELEEQLKEEKEQKPKKEDIWDCPMADQSTGQAPVAPGPVAEVKAKDETFVTKEEDKVIIPSHLVFYDESKEDVEPLPTAKVNVTEVQINNIKVEFEETPACDDTHGDNNHSDDNHADDAVMDDPGGADDDHDDDEGAEMKEEEKRGKNVKNEKNSGSDEEYFPSDTWARSPPALPPTPATPRTERVKAKNSTCQICHKKLSSKGYLRVHMRVHTGEKPYKCYICGRAFITANKMHRHVLRHDETWEGKIEVKPEEGTEDTTETEDPVDKKVRNGAAAVKSEPEPETEEPKGKGKKKKKKIKKKSNIDKAKSKLLAKSKKSFFEKKKMKNVKWTHVCEFCNQRFLHLETLEVHKMSHSAEDKVLKCQYCLEPQLDKEALTEHEASHAGPKPYMCTMCGNVYKKKGAMVLHRKTRCKKDCADKMFVCDICSKRYNSHTKLQRHMVSHSVNKFTLRYECPVCAHMFHTRYHVQMHLRSHMKEGLILEENRNAVLAMVLQNARKIPKSNDGVSANLTEAVPSDERSRICNICGQIFNHFYYLEEHLKTHGSKIAIQDLDKEEEKKYTCPVCSKSFKLHYYLKLHSYTHTKEKPYICQQCGKGFITKGKLKRHLETHQGLKKYQCHICYKFFTRPSYLRIHVRTIHGTQDYNFGSYGIGVPIGTIGNEDL